MASRPAMSVEATIRQASSSTGEDGGDGFGSISVGDTSMRLPDVDPTGGGASRLGKASVGSSALQAALLRSSVDDRYRRLDDLVHGA